MGLLVQRRHLFLIQGDPAGVSRAGADHVGPRLVLGAGLEPWRPVVHVKDGDLDSGGGVVRRADAGRCQRGVLP